MNISTVSSKYQIVIPRALREKLRIKPGQRVYLDASKSGEIIVRTTSQVTGLYGSMAGAWGSDSDKYLSEFRKEADRDRA